MSIDASQRFIFGLEGSPEPLGSFKLDNIYVPTISSPSQTSFDIRNNDLSGYRWLHETSSTDTYGSFKLQKFLTGSSSGIDIMSFNDDGSFTVPGFTLPSKYIIQQPDVNLPNSQALSSLSTGILKNTTGTGILSVAVPGVDYLSMSGGTLTGDLILNGDPTNPLGAVTRQYADAISQGLNFKNSCYAATTANLTAAYINGSSGVGATLANSGSLAAFSIDGVNPPLNSRVLVKNQSSGFQNGIYTVTTVGNGSTAWVLTRASDYNQTVEIKAGDFVVVDNGTANTRTAWVETATISTIGTDSIIFSSFGTSGTVTSVTGTAGQINVINGTSTPVISIDPAYLGAAAPNSAKYIIQTANASLTNAQVLGELTTGILKNTTSTGELIIATAGTDYYSPNNPTIIKDTDTSNFNISLGKQSLSSITSATDTTAMGYQTLNALTSGVHNTGFGARALKATLDGEYNTAIGADALGLNTSGDGNVAIGTDSLGANTTGSYNVALGSNTLRNLSNGSWNIALGTSTLGVIMNGSNNIAVGVAAGGNETVYNNCIFLGWHADSTVTNLTNAIAIGYDAKVSTSNSMVLGNGVNVGIGTSSPTTGKLVVNGGVQNVANEETAIRVTGALNSIKIELQNTDVNGRLFEIGSTSSGLFNVKDKTSGLTSVTLDPSGITTSIFSLANTDSSGIASFRAKGGVSGDYLDIGYDGGNGYSFINIQGASNDRLAFRVNGTGIGALLASGLFGLGTITPTLAKLQINGGVQNIVGEESAIRVISALSSVKIELQNTTPTTGKLYEIRSGSTGGFDIVDRTASAARFAITSSGNIGLNMGLAAPNAPLQFPNTTGNRKIVLFETANNDHQFSGFGLNTNEVRYQVGSTAASHIFYAGVNSTTSNEVARITGTGNISIPGTFFGRLPSGMVYMEANVTTTALTANVWSKIAGTTTALLLNQFTSPVSNRLTHTGANPIVVSINCSATLNFSAGGGNTLRSIAIFKNGAQITPSLISEQNASGINISMSTQTFVSLSTNDYIEVYCRSSANSNVTAANLILTATAT